MKKIYLLLSLLFAVYFSQGQLMSEPFNYTASPTAGLASQSGGVWAIFNGGDSILVENGSLSYSGLAASSGNKVTFGAAGSENYRPFTSQTSGTVYYSFLLNISSLGAINTTGGYCAGFIDNGTSNFTARLWLRLSGAANFNVGINAGSTAANTAWSSATLSPGTTYLIVASFQFVAGANNDVGKVWVNPASLGGSEPASDATSTNAAPAVDPTSIQRFFFRQDGTAATPAALAIDEVRVGTSWADVTPTGAAVPTISAGANISNITTTVGVASAQQSYNLSAANLTPAAGDITITPPVGVEVSLTNGGPYITSPSTLTVPYASGTVSPPVPVYVRISASAPQGVFADTILNTGGGAPVAKVAIGGGVFQNYYNTKANNGLTNISTWSTTTDGTGPSPSDFTSAYQLFNIINQTNANYTGVWNVANAGNTARVIVGDGTTPINFTVLSALDSLTSATRVDVLNNSTLTILNNRRPFLNNLATGSTVDFAQTGLSTTDTIKVPTLSYHHLKLTNGIKVLSSGTTTIRGNLTIDGVINFNGAPSPFSTVNSFGDIFFANGTTFEGNPSGDGNRLTLALNGNSGSQSILGNGTTLRLFRLRRDTVTSSVDINLGSNTNLILGNNSGGGLQLNQGASTTTNLDMGSNSLTLIGGAASTTTSLGKITASGGIYTISKSTVANSAGTLRFFPGSSVDQIVLNFDPTQVRDSITIADNLLVNTSMTFTRGRLVMTSPSILELAPGVTITQGADTAFVDGKLKINTNTTTGYIFPLGKANTYRLLTLTPASTTASAYTAEYFAAPYSTLTFNAPLTGVSNTEYWDVVKNSGANATIALSLNGVAVPGATASDDVVVAHFESGNWVSVNGTAITPGNAITGTAISNTLTTFSPFTFGIKLPGLTYTFNGNGNWSNPANWVGGNIPPTNLPAPNQILINPSPGGECVFDIAVQHIAVGAQLIVNPNAKFRLLGNLQID